MRISGQVLRVAALVLGGLVAGPSLADPVVLDRSYAGNINFVVTGATMRTESNAGNSCAVTNGPVLATLSGIPDNSDIVAAYLYWGGSGPTIDDVVTFQGVSRTADRTFTETFNQGGFNLQYFGGLLDVTAEVIATGNGSYQFEDLAVTTTDLGAGETYCSSSAVVAGWGMIAVYENDVTEPLRVVNLFDGLQFFRGSSITLTPSNFRIPNSNIDGSFAVLSWEGDVENSADLNGFSEDLSFNGVDLFDGFNPINNQFNSTINVLSSNTTYGVDFDLYDVSSLLTAGDQSATTVYASGGDLVLLALEAISVTNTPVADIAITKTVSQTLESGAAGQFAFSVSNNGPLDEPASVTVTDTLDGNLTYAGFSSTDANWNCSAAGQVVTCVYSGSVADGVTLDDVLVDVSVAAVASGTPLSNTADVAGTLFDNISANDSSTVNTTIVSADLSTSAKSVLDTNGGDVEPGDTLRYTITLTETNGLAVSGVSVTDDLPAQISSFSVSSSPLGSTVVETPAPGGANGAGQVVVSNITVPASGSVVIEIEAVVGAVSAGDLISNTANITAPAPFVAALGPVSVIALASTVPGSANKPLYIYTNDLADGTLQRIEPTDSPNTSQINGNNTSIFYNLSPQLERDLVLNAGTVPVFLCLDRNNAASGSGRNLRVNLFSDNGVDPPVLLDTGTATGILTTNGWNQVLINLTVAGQTIDDGSVIRLQLINESPANNRRFRLTSQRGACTTRSSVVLDAATIINVESVETYDAISPGGTPQTIVFDDGASTYYARTVISDPFGSFDITSAFFELLDKDSNVVIGPTDMGAFVAESTADGLRTYELSFTVPPSSGSPYTLRVTGNEGNEGVFDIGLSGLEVRPFPPLLSISKVASTTPGGPQILNSDSGAAAPTLFFTVEVSNMGTGAATNVEIADAFSQFLALRINSYGGQPFDFIDGAPSSGLTLGTPSYSNDLGLTYGYSLTSNANGAGADFDGEVTNFVLPLIGTMPPGSSFTLRYQMRVE